MTNKKSIYTALLCIANLLIIVLIINNFEVNQKIVFKEKSKDGFSITPVEVCKFDVDENWKWCHKPESELLCKTNYPLQKKKSDLMFLLNQVTQVFAKYDVRWWLDFGTLLGAVRENKIISWDYNIDISVVDKDFRDNFEEIMGDLHSCSNHLKPFFWESASNFTNLLGRFKTKKEPQFSLEITPWILNVTSFRMNQAGWGDKISTDIFLSQIFPIHNIEMEGRECPAPRKFRTALERNYGKEWDLPIQSPHFHPDRHITIFKFQYSFDRSEGKKIDNYVASIRMVFSLPASNFVIVDHLRREINAFPTRSMQSFYLK